MPSNSYTNFERKQLEDVSRLIQAYYEAKGDDPGKRALDHFTRSGIMMLSSAWEVYVEDVLQETADYFTSLLSTPNDLHKNVRKELSRWVKREGKNISELEPLKLAGDGWKEVYREMVRTRTNALNTPKKDLVDELFKRLVGIDELSKRWSNADAVNNLAGLRGQIAHRGKAHRYVKCSVLEAHVQNIRTVVVETDMYLAHFIGSMTKTRRPWNSTY